LVRTNNGKAARAKLLLVLGAMAESEALLAELEARDDFQLVRAADGDLAETLLRDSPVSLVLACPETPVPEIERLVAAVRRSRRGIPVLAIRNASSGEAYRWAELGVGVLRAPLLPDALARSVEVVLGLKKA
jgi:DNA-binding response OmpR family regulator